MSWNWFLEKTEVTSVATVLIVLTGKTQHFNHGASTDGQIAIGLSLTLASIDLFPGGCVHTPANGLEALLGLVEAILFTGRFETWHLHRLHAKSLQLALGGRRGWIIWGSSWRVRVHKVRHQHGVRGQMHLHGCRSSVASWHLWLKFVVPILQRFDVILLAEEEVGGHRLAHNQHTGQKGQSCHLISPGRAAILSWRSNIDGCFMAGSAN